MTAPTAPTALTPLLRSARREGAAPIASRGTVARRIVDVFLRRAVPRLLVAAALLVIGGTILSRYLSGLVTEPVEVAPGVVGERGGGAWLYALRTGAGVVLVDAGSDRKGRPIDAALATLGSTRAAVTDVLLTHGHPDETGGLAAVPRARVHAGAGDVDIIAGRERPGRGLDRAVGLVLPRTTARVGDPIRGEEEIDVGGQRVLAIPVPGHSLGSTAYLVGDLLFVGDAASVRDGKLVPGPRFMSADPRRAERALVRLALRLAGVDVSRICTAHGGCSPAGSARGLIEGVARLAGPDGGSRAGPP